MMTSKKLLIIVLLLAIGVFIYKLDRKKTTANINSEQISSKNETESLCDEQLKNMPSDNVETFEGKPHTVDFATLPDAKQYHTTITKTVSEGSNFAGHYSLASWGCGTDCFGYAVIDTKTGEIVSYNPANPDYLMGSINLKSMVFVLNPVYAGQEKRYYKIVEGKDGKSQLELACTEKSTKDIYGLPN